MQHLMQPGHVDRGIAAGPGGLVLRRRRTGGTRIQIVQRGLDGGNPLGFPGGKKLVRIGKRGFPGIFDRPLAGEKEDFFVQAEGEPPGNILFFLGGQPAPIEICIKLASLSEGILFANREALILFNLSS